MSTTITAINPVRLQHNRIRALMGAGNWLVAKARAQARKLGTQHAARNLRKQGVPVELAVQILARRF